MKKILQHIKPFIRLDLTSIDGGIITVQTPQYYD